MPVPRRSGIATTLAALGALLALAPGELPGQTPAGAGDRLPPRFFGGGAFVVLEPSGEFADFVDAAYGLSIHGRVEIDPGGWLSLRGEGGFARYGNEERTVCSPVSCRVLYELETSNNVLWASAGPEIAYPGERIRPYAHVGLGVGYFRTSSGLGGTRDHDDFASTTNLSDAALQWSTGAGLRLRITGGRTPLSVDVGWARHWNGEVEFLTEGDIVDHPDGTISIFPNRAEANVDLFRVGVSVGIPRDREEDGEHR